jgi:Ca2+-transporting ATPase
MVGEFMEDLKLEQKSIQEILSVLKTDQITGLSDAEAEKRLKENGPNAFLEKKPKTKLQMFISQLRDPMIYILFAAVVISSLLREYSDAVIIVTVILLNATIGMIQEGKAEKSLEALKKMSSPTAMVRRNGQKIEIPADQLVIGDLVILEAGRIVPADLRLLSSINLQIEESALTGESVPVQKDACHLCHADAALGDRFNLAYLSTAVTYGRGEGIVIKTGMETEVGKIARMINDTVEELTPLQKRLGDLGLLLGVVAVILCIALFGIAIFQGRDLGEMLLTAISLAVAAIPEGLPAVVTIVLALGVQRMAKVHTIVRKLPAVETLGSVSIVCSDKTGTLTQNKMTVVKCYANSLLLDSQSLDPIKHRTLLEGFVLCTDATVNGASRFGDPTELALIDMGLNLGLSKENLEIIAPRIDELAFDSNRKMMTTVHQESEGISISYTKGALDRVILESTAILINGEERPITEADKAQILSASKEMASGALRVLALARKQNVEEVSETGLTFVGLAGMIDPPRPEAKEAVSIFKEAHIITVMITGDHKDTAFAIAKELGIVEEEQQCIDGDALNTLTQLDLNAMVPNLRVFARVSPEHKVMIVKAFKSHGHIVSMTGDGVNDAPSLKAADIGVAMGITGTDVAKGASDMILTDDNFATIQKAIEEGRNIYNNIRKSVLFLLSSNFGEIVTMFVAILVGFASPLKAIHILWVNLITDSLPGLALGVDPKETDSMREAPRNPKENLFANGWLAVTLFFGVVIGLITLSAYLLAPLMYLSGAGLSLSIESVKATLENPQIYVRAQTYAFNVLAMSQLFHAIGMRNLKRSIFRFNHLANKTMLLAFCVGMMLQVAVTEIPFLTAMFGTVSLSFKEWLTLILLATAPVWCHELLVLGQYIRRRRISRNSG